METIVLLAFPAAIVMAVGCFFVDEKNVAVCTAASYICCAVPVICGFADINSRAAAGEIGSVNQIYSMMTAAGSILFVIVTALNITAYIVRRRK